MTGCCFRGCDRTDQQPTVCIRVWPPSDEQPVSLWSHLDCFESRREATVAPDPKHEYGHIPAKACCVFCGDPLPIVGVHPYAMDVGEGSSASRFWAHAECIENHIIGLKI